jgi:hypothetical protein
LPYDDEATMRELMKDLLDEFEEHRAMLVKTTAGKMPEWNEGLLKQLADVQGAIQAVKAEIENDIKLSGR